MDSTLGITGYALLSGALVAISRRRIRFINRILTLSWLRMAGKCSYEYLRLSFLHLPHAPRRYPPPWMVDPFNLSGKGSAAPAPGGSGGICCGDIERRVIWRTPFLRLKKYFKTA